MPKVQIFLYKPKGTNLKYVCPCILASNLIISLSTIQSNPKFIFHRFQITINDLPVGRDVDETLRLVQAFKFTDEHGEVCPAGWKPGKKTMKPDAEGVAKYLGENKH